MLISFYCGEKEKAPRMQGWGVNSKPQLEAVMTADSGICHAWAPNNYMTEIRRIRTQGTHQHWYGHDWRTGRGQKWQWAGMSGLPGKDFALRGKQQTASVLRDNSGRNNERSSIRCLVGDYMLTDALSARYSGVVPPAGATRGWIWSYLPRNALILSKTGFPLCFHPSAILPRNRCS